MPLPGLRLDRGVGSASARLQREKEMGKAVWTKGQERCPWVVRARSLVPAVLQCPVATRVNCK